MSRQRIVTGEALSAEEEGFHYTLRPRTLDEFIGHRPLVEKLRITLEAARQRGEPVEHTIFYGPPGLGKTTLAHIVAHEMGGELVTASGPVITRPGDLMGLLTNLETGGVLFLDEIHRLPTAVEEFLYSAMEEFQVDFLVDKGPFSKKIRIPLKPFTLIGATTRMGLLSAPLRERFGILHHLDFYPPGDLCRILHRSAGLLQIPLVPDAATLLSDRARGTPRVANRLLRRVRDYAEVKGDGQVTAEMAERALELEGIDSAGLDELDRKFLRTILDTYRGGPVGIEALAASLSEEPDTLSELVEPFLLKCGFLTRTRNGRCLTEAAHQYLGQHLPLPKQPNLWAPGGGIGPRGGP